MHLGKQTNLEDYFIAWIKIGVTECERDLDVLVSSRCHVARISQLCCIESRPGSRVDVEHITFIFRWSSTNHIPNIPQATPGRPEQNIIDRRHPFQLSRERTSGNEPRTHFLLNRMATQWRSNSMCKMCKAG